MKTEEIKKTENIDFGLFIIISVLAIAGTIMIISSSSAYAYHYLNGDTYHFLRKQIIWLLLGSVALIIGLRINLVKLKNFSFILYIISILLLIFVLVPGIGQKYNDARRWYSFMNVSFQPSELYKITLVLFLSARLSWDKHRPDTFKKFLVYFMFIIIPVGLIIIQPHISASILIIMISLTLMFYAGAKIRYYIFSLAILVPVLALIVKFSDYAQSRIYTFLNAGNDPSGEGFQILQSLYAISSGGIFGVGPGKSLLKFMYLPEPYNDFIFSIFCEEYGFIGVMLLFMVFTAFMLKGYLISKNVQDKFMSYTAFGIVTMVMMQFIINVAVVTATIPVTGMPLPFFSYGGTSFVILMGQMGLLLNISQYRQNTGLAAKIKH
jgi:cell division protein FtsW